MHYAIHNGFRLGAGQEVTLNGQPFLLDVTPIVEDGRPAGGVDSAGGEAERGDADLRPVGGRRGRGCTGWCDRCE